MVPKWLVTLVVWRRGGSCRAAHTHRDETGAPAHNAVILRYSEDLVLTSTFRPRDPSEYLRWDEEGPLLTLMRGCREGRAPREGATDLWKLYRFSSGWTTTSTTFRFASWTSAATCWSTRAAPTTGGRSPTWPS